MSVNIIELNAEKLKLFDQISNSTDHFFITGKAGTGKSLLLQYLKRNTQKNLVVAAPTGVAALNVGGQTIHSLFLIPPTFISPDSLPYTKKIATLLKHLDILVIDEISMVRADLMDAIDYRLRQCRDSKEPFGGVQLVMFGDLYQLPPIITDPVLNQYFLDNHGGFHFFNALVWQKAKFKTYELTEVFRQKDEDFKQLLNAIRTGQANRQVLADLNVRAQTEPPDDGYVYLTTNNYKANRINAQKLSLLESNERTYRATVKGDFDAKNYPADDRLKLKIGAQVMLLRNDTEKRWVNGTIGQIVSLTSDNVSVDVSGTVYKVPVATWNKVRYYFDTKSGKMAEEVTSSFTQIPLRLAWALTIHKSQGKTFDNVVIDLDHGSFSSGQTYVALSRCTSLKGIYLTQPIRPQDIIVDRDVTTFMQTAQKQ